MNRLEARIRDFLAERLEIIEPGLRLVSKEFELRNDIGSGGFIDLLARDQLGHYVVIEIKRSDQAARAALHELTKYVALLRANQGLRRDQIRAILVSTEWHELAVPFSEYLNNCEVPTEGFVISTESSGEVTSVKRFEQRELARALVISRSQDIILFRQTEHRDDAICLVIEAAKKTQLQDFVLLSVDYGGANPDVIYPHGVYLVFSSPLQTMSSQQAEAIKRHMEWEDELEEPDENFLLAFRNALGSIGDDSEIGYPEKLNSMAASGWGIQVAHRAGRYASNGDLVPNIQLIENAKRIEGGAAYYLCRTASPKYTPSWKQMKEDSKVVLLGNTAWSTLIGALLDEIERDRPRATVSVYLYNPANIVFGVAKLCRYGDLRYLPSLQLIIADADEVILYVGMLSWNGQSPSFTVEHWINKAFGSTDEFLAMQHFGATCERDDLARRLLGFDSVVFEARCAGTTSEKTFCLSYKKGKLFRMPRESFTDRSLVHFCSENPDFASSLVATAMNLSAGWVN